MYNFLNNETVKKIIVTLIKNNASSCGEQANVNIFITFSVSIRWWFSFFVSVMSFWVAVFSQRFVAFSTSRLEIVFFSTHNIIHNFRAWCLVEQKRTESEKEVNKLALERPRKRNKNIIHLFFINSSSVGATAQLSLSSQLFFYFALLCANFVWYLSNGKCFQEKYEYTLHLF